MVHMHVPSFFYQHMELFILSSILIINKADTISEFGPSTPGSWLYYYVAATIILFWNLVLGNVAMASLIPRPLPWHVFNITCRKVRV